jgi:spore coat protein CotH
MSHDDVFDIDALHTVSLTIDPAHIPTLDDPSRQHVPCDVVLDGVAFPGAHIKEKGSHGSSATLAEKSGFTISFGAERPAGLKKLTLNNSRQDDSFLHEHLAHKLYRLAGLPASRTAYGAVRVNDTGLGLYVVKEKVDRSFLKRTFGAGNDEGNLYEVVSHDFLEGAANHAFLELKDEDEGRTREDIADLAQASGRAVRRGGVATPQPRPLPHRLRPAGAAGGLGRPLLPRQERLPL